MRDNGVASCTALGKVRATPEYCACVWREKIDTVLAGDLNNSISDSRAVRTTFRGLDFPNYVLNTKKAYGLEVLMLFFQSPERTRGL